MSDDRRTQAHSSKRGMLNGLTGVTLVLQATIPPLGASSIGVRII